MEQYGCSERAVLELLYGHSYSDELERLRSQVRLYPRKPEVVGNKNRRKAKRMNELRKLQLLLDPNALTRLQNSRAPGFAGDDESEEDDSANNVQLHVSIEGPASTSTSTSTSTGTSTSTTLAPTAPTSSYACATVASILGQAEVQSACETVFGDYMQKKKPEEEKAAEKGGASSPLILFQSSPPW